MPLSILYCAECELILAAAPALNFVAACVAHDASGVMHTGYQALRLATAEVTSAVLADLSALALAYPKNRYAEQLESLAGACL